MMGSLVFFGKIDGKTVQNIEMSWRYSKRFGVTMVV